MAVRIKCKQPRCDIEVMAKKRNKRPRHTKEVMEETEADDTQPLQLHNAQALNFVKKPEITIKCQRPGCTKIIQRFEVDH